MFKRQILESELDNLGIPANRTHLVGGLMSIRELIQLFHKEQSENFNKSEQLEEAKELLKEALNFMPWEEWTREMADKIRRFLDIDIYCPKCGQRLSSKRSQ